MFGRSQWVEVDNSCVPLPGAVPLDQIAAALAARGRSATGAVIPSRTKETAQYCDKLARYPIWPQLGSLRDQYGWTFVSAGTNYTDVTQLTPEEQLADSCGSLQTFRDHGHNRAWGLFAYPNHKSNNSVGSIVSSCFSYGRVYGQGSSCHTCLTSPWFQTTNTVNGGRCNNPALPCYDVAADNTQKRYMSPLNLANLMKPGPDRWSSVQMYRLVTGSYTGEHHSWDCTSADWRDHWTNEHEMYCYTDYFRAVDSIPPTVVVTDPATVAESWGRGFGS
jgi:hypothetical protein